MRSGLLNALRRRGGLLVLVPEGRQKRTRSSEQDTAFVSKRT
jgi:hypothetical protein